MGKRRWAGGRGHRRGARSGQGAGKEEEEEEEEGGGRGGGGREST